ncbi:MAG: hypothetical protein ACW99G_11430 [Candidatus Thorarchaeota archaeon]|jgi:hypothetical protein
MSYLDELEKQVNAGSGVEFLRATDVSSKVKLDAAMQAAHTDSGVNLNKAAYNRVKDYLRGRGFAYEAVEVDANGYHPRGRWVKGNVVVSADKVFLYSTEYEKNGEQKTANRFGRNIRLTA